MPVASAQLKSAILLAGLFADSPTTVVEPAPSRDHTERMLRGLGAQVVSNGTEITLTPPKALHAVNVEVPGDISSAAYFLVAGLILPDSDIVIRNVGINPTRTGILDALRPGRKYRASQRARYGRADLRPARSLLSPARHDHLRRYDSAFD